MKHKRPYPPRAEIKARCKAIGLTLAALAAEAKVARSTIFRAGNGRGSHTGTLDAIVDTLEGRELAMLKHLIALHGIPEAEERDAA